MAKPSEQAQVNFIMTYLRKGWKRKSILTKFVAKWQTVSERTFDRRLKQAEMAVADEQQQIKDKAEQQVAKEAGELKDQIISSLERQAILSQIAKGEVKIPNTKFFYDSKVGEVMSQEVEELPDHGARIKAINELNRMDGSHAPTKADVTTGGEKIQQQTTAAVIQFDGKSIEILK